MCVVRFLSDEWFEFATNGLEEIALDDRATGRLNFTAGTNRWHLSLASGRVASFGSGHLDAADAELQWEPTDARAIVLREVRGDEAMQRTTVVAPKDNGRYVGPP